LSVKGEYLCGELQLLGIISVHGEPPGATVPPIPMPRKHTHQADGGTSNAIIRKQMPKDAIEIWKY